jgi:hypothetical protein
LRGHPQSLGVSNVLRRLDRARIDATVRNSADPRFGSFYLIYRATNALPSDDLFSEAVDALSYNGSAPLAPDAKGRICIEVTLIGSLGPAIAVILILAVGNLGAGHTPAEQYGDGSQGGYRTDLFGPAQHRSLPVYAGDTDRHRAALTGSVGWEP